jgi:LPS export ABC transporter protein LptC
VILKHPIFLVLFASSIIVLASCEDRKEHIAPAIYEEDSTSMMISYGVNTLISDSGVMKYRIIAEEWEINTVKNPSRWIFNKGLFMEQFDEKFHVEAYVQADTAFYYDQIRIWELRNNVRIRTTDGLRFSSNELFWDQQKREFYSHMPSTLITPERTMHGTYFRSDEQMTRYLVTNSKGSFESADFSKDSEKKENTDSTITLPKRQQTIPMRKQ